MEITAKASATTIYVSRLGEKQCEVAMRDNVAWLSEHELADLIEALQRVAAWIRRDRMRE